MEIYASMLIGCVCLFVCLSVSVFIRLCPTGHNLRAIFTELHIHAGTSPRKNWLYCQGHRSKRPRSCRKQSINLFGHNYSIQILHRTPRRLQPPL